MAQLAPIQVDTNSPVPEEPEIAQLQNDVKSDPNIRFRRARSKTIETYTRSNSARKKKKKSPRKKKKKTAATTSPRKFKQKAVPRKLGPRDVGRNKYKQGTKLNADKGSYGNFLDEKITFHSRNTSFLARKTANPVPKKESVQETGTPNSWKKPEYYKKEVQKMYKYNNARRGGWGGTSDEIFEDKPFKPKDKRLEALKNEKIPKGIPIKQYGSPNAWKPIQYKYENNGGSFLNEKFWFESSHVQIDGGLSKLIEALPPEKKLKLNKMPAPTGYRSKIMFLRKLREFVMAEIQRLHRDDIFIQNMETKQDDDDDDDDDITYIDKLSKEIELDLGKELDDALDEVLGDNDNDNDIDNDNDDNKKNKKSVRFAVSDKEEEKEEKKEKRDSLHIGGKSTMTLDIDLEDAIDGIMDSDDDDDDGELLENRYKKLLRRKNSEMGLFQRKLLTMKSVNKLTDLIEDIEKQDTPSSID